MKQIGGVALVACLLAGVVAGGAVTGVQPERNEAPLVDAGLDQAVAVGATVMLDGGGTRDPDGRIDDYRWSIETPAGGTTKPDCPTCERTSFAATQRGTYAVTLVATDDDGATGSDTLYVRVGGDATGPSVQLTGPRSATVGGRERYTARLAPGTAALETVRWSVGGSVVATETLGANQRRAHLTRRFTSAGATRVSVTVVDEAGRTASDSLRVSVAQPRGNVAPVVDLVGPSEVVAGESATYRARAVDRDGAIVDVDWWASDEGTVDGSRTLAKSFDGDVGDTVTISVTVRDDSGATASDELQVDLVGRPRSCSLEATITGPRFVEKGETARFGVSTNRQIFSVAWSPSDGDVLNARGTTYQREFTEDIGATVEVQAEVDSGDCKKLLTKTIRVTFETSNRSTNRDFMPIIENDISYEISVNGDPNDGDMGPSENGRNHHWTVQVSHKGGEDVKVIWEFSDGVVKTQTIPDLDGTRSVTVQRTVTYETRDTTAPEKLTRLSVEAQAIDQTSDSATVDWSGEVYANPIVLNSSMDRMVVSVSPGTRVAPGTALRFRPNVRTAFAVRWGDGSARREYPTSTDTVTYTYDQPGVYTAEFISNNGHTAQVGRATVHVVQQRYQVYRYDIKIVEREETQSAVDPDELEADATDDWVRATKVDEKWRPTSTYRTLEQWEAPDRFHDTKTWREAGSTLEYEQITRTTVSATSPGAGWSLVERRVRRQVQRTSWSSPSISAPTTAVVWEHRWQTSTYSVTRMIRWQKYEKVSDVFAWVKEDVYYEQEVALQQPEPGTYRPGSLEVRTYECADEDAPLSDQACDRLNA